MVTQLSNRYHSYLKPWGPLNALLWFRSNLAVNSFLYRAPQGLEIQLKWTFLFCYHWYSNIWVCLCVINWRNAYFRFHFFQGSVLVIKDGQLGALQKFYYTISWLFIRLVALSELCFPYSQASCGSCPNLTDTTSIKCWIQ